jgi:hypothetical protein
MPPIALVLVIDSRLDQSWLRCMGGKEIENDDEDDNDF